MLGCHRSVTSNNNNNNNNNSNNNKKGEKGMAHRKAEIRLTIKQLSAVVVLVVVAA
jgi:hypothetical protein